MITKSLSSALISPRRCFLQMTLELKQPNKAFDTQQKIWQHLNFFQYES